MPSRDKLYGVWQGASRLHACRTQRECNCVEPLALTRIEHVVRCMASSNHGTTLVYLHEWMVMKLMPHTPTWSGRFGMCVCFIRLPTTSTSKSCSIWLAWRLRTWSKVRVFDVPSSLALLPCSVFHPFFHLKGSQMRILIIFSLNALWGHPLVLDHQTDHKKISSWRSRLIRCLLEFSCSQNPRGDSENIQHQERLHTGAPSPWRNLKRFQDSRFHFNLHSPNVWKTFDSMPIPQIPEQTPCIVIMMIMIIMVNARDVHEGLYPATGAAYQNPRVWSTEAVTVIPQPTLLKCFLYSKPIDTNQGNFSFASHSRDVGLVREGAERCICYLRTTLLSSFMKCLSVPWLHSIGYEWSY